jgi:hypothetical protein
LPYLLDPEDGDDMFLGNVVISQEIVFFITSTVRTWNYIYCPILGNNDMAYARTSEVGATAVVPLNSCKFGKL